MDELIQKLIEFVETASPVLWESAYRQVYVEVAQLVIVIIVAILLGLGGFALRRKQKQLDGDDDGILWLPISSLWVCSVACLWMGVSGIIGHLLNPNWYAIKILLGLAGWSQ
jgi:hypothetical protein